MTGPGTVLCPQVPQQTQLMAPGCCLRAHPKQKKSSLGTNQNITSPHTVPLVPSASSMTSLGQVQISAPFDFLSLALHPVSETGIDPDLNMSWIDAMLSCKSFLSRYSSAETERKTLQPTMPPWWKRLGVFGKLSSCKLSLHAGADMFSGQYFIILAVNHWNSGHICPYRHSLLKRDTASQPPSLFLTLTPAPVIAIRECFTPGFSTFIRLLVVSYRALRATATAWRGSD